VPADPRASVCEPAIAPPASWVVERVATRGPFIEALEVALPPALVGTGRTDFALPAYADTLGSVLAASWGEGTSPPVGERARFNVAVWIGPEDGYPSIGADTSSRQLYARQCRMRVGDGERFVTEFALRSPLGTGAYLGAVWPITRQRYIRVLVSELEEAHLTDARVIVASMRAVPRPSGGP
jgi:hypothetical protein